MRVPPTSVIAIVLLVGVGCRPRQTAGDVALADDIDAIEQALAQREAELESEGIVVAARDDYAAGAGDAAGPPGADAPTPTEDDVVGEAVQEAPATPQEVESTMPAANSPSDAPQAESRRAARVSDRRSDAARRCERICDLAESTCALGDRICTLASRHLGDPRYALACGRAQQQCTAAREHCDGC